MAKIGWALVLLLLVMQAVVFVQLYESNQTIARVLELDEETAILKNQAALLEVQNERIRHNYYKVLEGGPLVLTEEQVADIIKQGVK